MLVKQFMLANLPAIQTIISVLPRPFDTHTFIRALSREFQTDYVCLLSQYSNDPFQTVNGQIGRFLSDKQEELSIVSQGKVLSANIFGENTENEQWI